MIICSCNVISDHDIRSVVVSADIELCSAAQVYDCLGCIVQCGLCSRAIRQILGKRPFGYERQLGCPVGGESTAPFRGDQPHNRTNS